jgi:hypothetical protein
MWFVSSLLWRDFVSPESATSHHPFLLHEHDIFLIVYQQKLAQTLLFSWITWTAMATVIGVGTGALALASFANSVVENLHNAYSLYRSAPRVILDLADHITACLVQIDFFQQNVDSSELPLSPNLKKIVDYHTDRVREAFYSEVKVWYWIESSTTVLFWKSRI